MNTNICKICNNSKENTFFKVSEMMLGTNDKFIYLECINCGCLSLIDIPKDIGKYYPTFYYSFTKPIINYSNSWIESIKKLIRKSAMIGYLGQGTVVNTMINKMKHIYYPWLKKGLISIDSKILDVGCGNGFLLFEMSQYGFTHLYGIDLFIEDMINDNQINFFKSNIYNLKEDNFDLIMYHHSFEHIETPHLELDTLYDKLKDTGTLIIRVPVCDSFAFRVYKEHWVQLDAPRHIFLYTQKSIKILAELHGFKIDDYMYDSNSFQFIGSECYIRNIPLSQTIFTQNEVIVWEEKAKELNQLEDGDSMCFYLKKNIEYIKSKEI